jgi:hypothetical protein
MPDAPPAADAPVHEQRTAEAVVLDLLINGENRLPWSLHELALELGDPLAAADAVAGLQAAGLVHRLRDDFVFATRAALRGNQLRL